MDIKYIIDYGKTTYRFLLKYKIATLTAIGAILLLAGYSIVMLAIRSGTGVPVLPEFQYSEADLDENFKEATEKGYSRDIEIYYEYVRSNLISTKVSIYKYKIKPGDNLWKIRNKRKINIDTIVGANPFLKTLQAYTNEEIIILSRKGVLHKVVAGETVDSIAENYGVTTDIIEENNYMQLFGIERFIFIPSVVPQDMTEEMKKQFDLSRIFCAPLSGRYTSYMGYRKDPFTNTKSFHEGLDIAAKYGEQVAAVADGVVLIAAPYGDYGNMVKIKHDNGYVTLYGHNSKLLVKSGQKVKKGKIIALAGSTGRSTGCHLHFTVWKDDKLVDPTAFFIR